MGSIQSVSAHTEKDFVRPFHAYMLVYRLAEDYNLEQQYRKPFAEIWNEEKDDTILGPLSERMGVRERGGGPLLVSDEEMEAASEQEHDPTHTRNRY